MITVTYTSIDRVRKRRTFRTLSGARRFAQYWIGECPELGWTYAIAFDGIGKITCAGCTLRELFPATAD